MRRLLSQDEGRKAVFFVYRVGRRLSRFPLARLLIPTWLRSRVQNRLAAGVTGLLPDRRYMEGAIFPALASIGPSRLLDVGVQPYSQHYGDLLPADCERWTADIDPAAACFGSPGRHVIASVLELDEIFAKGSFDVILMNGIFGHGVDRLDEQEQAFAIAHALLREGGWLLVGWNRGHDGRPIIVAGGGSDEQWIRDPLTLGESGRSYAHAAPGNLPARQDFRDSSHIFDWFQAR